MLSTPVNLETIIRSPEIPMPPMNTFFLSSFADRRAIKGTKTTPLTVIIIIMAEIDVSLMPRLYVM